MKKKKTLYLILIVVIYNFCYSVVLAKCGENETTATYNGVEICYNSSLSGIGEAELATASGECSSGSTYCSASFPNGKLGFFGVNPNTPIYGIRITLIDASGDKVDKTKIINFWATNAMYNAFYQNYQYSKNLIRLDSQFRGANHSFAYFFDGSSLGIFSTNSANGYDLQGDGINYNDIIYRLLNGGNASKIRNIYDNFINCPNPSNKCSHDPIINTSFETLALKNYSFLIEPIFVLRATINKDIRWYGGTAYEIGTTMLKENKLEGSDKLNDVFVGALKCGNTNGWGGDWNVIDNFLTAIYVNETTSNIQGVNTNNTLCKNRLMDLLAEKKLGWSKYIIMPSYYSYSVTPENSTITIDKRASDGKSCYNDAAYFRVYSNSSATDIVMSGGKDNWCSESSTIVFDNLEKNKTYYIKEFSNSSYTTAINDYNYSINSGGNVSASNHNGVMTVKIDEQDNIFIKVKNGEKGCQVELEQIKNSSSSNSTKITNLLNLYKKYKLSGKNYNQILNFSINGSSLDLSGTSCNTLPCSNLHGSLSCVGNSTISENSNRVCFLAKSQTDIEDVGAYCTVSYELKNFKFSYDSVLAGNILWQSWEDSPTNRGIIDMNVHCEGIYNKSDSLSISYKNHLSKYVPLLRITSPMNLNLTSNPTNTDSFKYSMRICDASDSKCYYIWNKTFTYNVLSDNYWYSNNQFGILISQEKYNSLTSDKSSYQNIGSGVPIATDEYPGDKKATLFFVANGKSYYQYCPYTIKNQILKCKNGTCDDPSTNPLSKEYNFEFRIIDTDNPFPGIDGSSRKTGDNWCLTSIMGKKKNSGSLVGDLSGDGFIDEDDIMVSYFNSGNPNVDFNGDGNVTYSSSCISYPDGDNCVLESYIDETHDYCSGKSSENYLVKNNITDAPNSNSTDKPMYSFTLTPKEINAIRDYNKVNSYNDFNMSCESDSFDKCKSTFVTKWLDGFVNNGTSDQEISRKTTQDNSSCFNLRLSTGGHSWCSNK